MLDSCRKSDVRAAVWLDVFVIMEHPWFRGWLGPPILQRHSGDRLLRTISRSQSFDPEEVWWLRYGGYVTSGREETSRHLPSHTSGLLDLDWGRFTRNELTHRIGALSLGQIDIARVHLLWWYHIWLLKNQTWILGHEFTLFRPCLILTWSKSMRDPVVGGSLQTKMSVQKVIHCCWTNPK